MQRTYIPLRKRTHADGDKCPLAVPRSLNQRRIARLGRLLLHLDCVGNFCHFESNQRVRGVAAGVVACQRLFRFVGSAVGDEPSVNYQHASMDPHAQELI